MMSEKGRCMRCRECRKTKEAWQYWIPSGTS